MNWDALRDLVPFVQSKKVKEKKKKKNTGYYYF